MKNKAVVSTEKAMKDELFDHVQDMQKTIGKKLTPNGCEHIGSFSVFFYTRKSLVADVEYRIITQTDLRMIEEGLCDLGLKQARKDLMAQYGRSEKTRLQ